MPPESARYDTEPDLRQFAQGDILRNVPFPSWPTYLPASMQEKWAILRPLRGSKLASQPKMTVLPNYIEGRAQRDVPDAFSNIERQEYVMASFRLCNVMVISRSCSLDFDRRKHLIVSPVSAVVDLPEASRSEAKLLGLRADDIPHNFYLPETSGLSESFADLLTATYIHRSFLRDVKSQLVARLSTLGTMRLQMNLSDHFGTKFGYDAEDVCPKNGWYSCSACFHTGRPTEKARFKEGEVFGVCKVCGVQAAFVCVASE